MDLAAAGVDELFALARAAEDDDAYWACVSELHGRAQERTFELAEVLCDSFTAGERCLGADVLAQLGAQPGRSAAESPFAAASGNVLLRLLEQDDEPAVLSSAAVGLGHLRDERAIDRLVALASHADVNVRRGAVHGLMGHDDDRAVAALIGLSSDVDDDVRDWATFSLGVQIDRDTPALREALATRLGDSNPEARAEAILGLARRGDERALEPALAAAPAQGERAPNVEEAMVLLGESTGDTRLREHLERLREERDAREAYGERLDRALERCAAGPA
jgi:hypothetical protein